MKKGKQRPIRPMKSGDLDRLVRVEESHQKDFDKAWKEYQAENPNACMLEYIEDLGKTEPQGGGWCGTHRPHQTRSKK